MKTIAIWSRYGQLMKDGFCFNHSEAPIGDGLLKPYAALRERGASQWQCRVDTLDRLWAQAMAGGLDGAIFFDYPALHEAKAIEALRAVGVPLYLVTWENELICPEQWQPAAHRPFAKVFTWHNGWIRTVLHSGPPTYVPIRVPQDFGWTDPNPFDCDRSSRRFACLIASAKNAPRKADGGFDDRELYSKRVDTLQWFAIKAPRSLDLYGPGWDGAEMWKGVIPPGRKREVMSCYTFAFCYENAQGLPGYVTEKVFDAMMAGCIPIYWGAPDIRDYLPSKTFVDRRQFVDHESLFAYLANVDEQWREERRSAIRSFLADERLIKPWTIETFVDTILREVT